MSDVRRHGDGGHRALVYGDPGAFAAGAAAFVRSGLRDGDHVVAVLTPEKFGWLREELAGNGLPAVEHIAADAFYERPGPMLRAVIALLERHGRPGHGRVRIVAEQDLARRDPPHVRAYMRHEAATNLAVAGYDASILCPYDAARLPQEIIDAALRTHPEVLGPQGRVPSAGFIDPRAFVREYVRRPPRPPEAPSWRVRSPDDIGQAREWIRTQAHANGLPAGKVEDLVLVVSEVATNAYRYGEDPRILWSYVDGGSLVCQVRDHGPGPEDPLAGYLPPDVEAAGGRGLWIAHQLCDAVEVVSDRSGTDVYLRMRLA